MGAQKCLFKKDGGGGGGGGRRKVPTSIRGQKPEGDASDPGSFVSWHHESGWSEVPLFDGSVAVEEGRGRRGKSGLLSSLQGQKPETDATAIEGSVSQEP